MAGGFFLIQERSNFAMHVKETGKISQWFIVLCVILLAVVLSAGCGGGGSSPVGQEEQQEEQQENHNNNNNNTPPPNNPANPNTPDNPVTPENPVTPDNPVTPENPVQSEDIPVQDTVFRIIFDSDGGTLTASVEVLSGDIPEEPEDPEKDGFTFMGWYDSEDRLFEFDNMINDDIYLTAKWTQTITATNEEINDIDAAVIGGFMSVPLDASEESPIVSVDVSYILDGKGIIHAVQANSGPLMKISGLVGKPVDFSVIGDGKITSAEIMFEINPEKLSGVGINDLMAVWYDESNDIVVPLSCDVEENTITVKVDHFSQFALVKAQEWLRLWNSPLPDGDGRNIILLIDCEANGFISSHDENGNHVIIHHMNRTVDAAKKVIDSLKDDDYVTAAFFRHNECAYITSDMQNYYRLLYNDAPMQRYGDKSVAGDIYRKKIVQDGHDSRQEIKDWISSLRVTFARSIYDTPRALLAAMKYAVEEVHEKNNCAQSEIILISPAYLYSRVNDNDVNDMLASKTGEALKNDDGLNLIYIGGLDELFSYSGLIEFAQEVGGVYINASQVNDLAVSFDEALDGFAISSDDLDYDGLEDWYEIHGMKDQYGAVWSTDAKLRDTDYDSIIDGEEMGNKTGKGIYGQDLEALTHFKRVSNPLLTTKYSNQAYITVPDSMLAEHDIERQRIDLTIKIKDWRYSEDSTSETFYLEPANLKVELYDLPEEFTLQEEPHLHMTETINTRDKSKQLTYKAAISYKGKNFPNMTFINWRITADNISGTIERQQLLDVNKIQVKSGLLKTASTALAKVEQDFINAIISGINEKASSSTQLQKIKGIITATNSSIPDKIYEAFALAIIDVIGSSKVSAYETDMTKLVNQIYEQIQKGLDDRETDIVLDGNNYHVKFTVQALGGVFDAWADVSRNDTYMGHLMSTNYGSKDGMKALAEYCAVVAQLNTDLWKEVTAYYTTGIMKEIGLEKIELIIPDKSNPTKTKKMEINMQKAVSSVLDYSEIVRTCLHN